MVRETFFSVALLAATAAYADPVVPGTGVKVTMVGDDFEAKDWEYIPNGPKASYEQDGAQRPPGGRSKNGRWYESAMRGQPDVVRRIATPPGGLPGSQGSLFLATKFSGVPGQLSGKQMQDDLLMGIQSRLGRPIPVSWSPSVVVRVYLPEFHRWEQRNGSSFGVRCDVRGRTAQGKVEPYWPGMFILFRSSATDKYDRDFAQISVRARANGSDVPGPKIEEHGWWTFGISFTPDGQVHQYAREGVGDLTAADRLYSSMPYGNQTLFVDSFFVNVANLDNGRTWSTPWVIDDPTVYVIPPQGQSLRNLTGPGNGGTSSRGGDTAVNRMFDAFRR
ncbi:MAG TPA: hypothetical protein PKC18_11050 [Lacipirellulaceae bacterium]|nr:hypothetical protein [Lacipirellulaceae bacterium]